MDEKKDIVHKNQILNEEDVDAILHRLVDLGVNINDYYQIPTESIELKKVENEAPKSAKVISKHAIIIDSRQRDYTLYKTPNDYFIELFELHRNVERLELIAAMLPKTEYNITSENNLLVVTVSGIKKELYLTPGQYLIGSNIYGNVNYESNGNNNTLWGLIGEIKRVLNTGFSGFDVFLATAPPVDDVYYPSTGTGRNSSVLNRLVITNDTDDFIIDFTNEGYDNGSPFRVFGFDKVVTNSTLNNYIYGSSDTGNCTVNNLYIDNPWAITINSVIAKYDYNLIDDPKYIIMKLDFGKNSSQSAERIESIDVATNRKFAMIIYDANDPDNIQTYNSSASGSVKIQIDRKPGRLKALKGSDFDKKIINFSPPITIDSFNISFFKYDNTPYDFNNREHMLTFELDVVDSNSLLKY
jgi:hypothetical protein